MTWLKRNWKKLLIGFVIILAIEAAYIFYPEPKEDFSQLNLLAKNHTIRILRDTHGEMQGEIIEPRASA